MTSYANLQTLSIRALNASNATYKPVYAGLRVLLSNSQKCQGILANFIDRRSLNRASWRFNKFPMVKEAKHGADPVYRDCAAGSPITTLAEARILNLMAKEPCFSVPACAYSYRWPKGPFSGGNFAYYFEGYRERTVKVRELLRANPESVALIADLKAFYPSVDARKVASRLEARVSRIGNKATARRIRQFTSAYFGPNPTSGQGIPIGPDFSHVLGHLALDGVDEKLTRRYGEKYLRYVDDIILVVPRAGLCDADATLKNAVEEEGLRLNLDKRDFIGSGVWEENNPQANPPGGDSFEMLIEDLTFFVMRKTPDPLVLRRRFADCGFSLPFRRVVSRSRSVRLWQYLTNRMSFSWWRRSHFVTERSLLERAESLRGTLWRKAGAQNDVAPSSPMCRRWWARDWRYVINRLVYLLPIERYTELLNLIPDAPEFIETRILIDALQTGDASKILRYPGRCVCAFCELWREVHGGAAPKITWPTRPNAAEADSVAHLALLLGIHPPEAYLASLVGEFTESRFLIECCTCRPSENARPLESSFLDEMSLLFHGAGGETIGQLLSARYDESENLNLDSLLFGDSISECPAYPL